MVPATRCPATLALHQAVRLAPLAIDSPTPRAPLISPAWHAPPAGWPHAAANREPRPCTAQARCGTARGEPDALIRHGPLESMRPGRWRALARRPARRADRQGAALEARGPRQSARERRSASTPCDACSAPPRSPCARASSRPSCAPLPRSARSSRCCCFRAYGSSVVFVGVSGLYNTRECSWCVCVRAPSNTIMKNRTRSRLTPRPERTTLTLCDWHRTKDEAQGWHTPHPRHRRRQSDSRPAATEAWRRRLRLRRQAPPGGTQATAVCACRVGAAQEAE